MTAGPRRRRILRAGRLDADGVAALLRAKVPALVNREAVAHWGAMAWTPTTLRERHGDRRVRVVVDAPDGSPWTSPAKDHLREMPLSAFVDHLRSPARTRPCMMALEPLSVLPGLEGDVDFGSLCGGGDVRISIGSAGVQIGVHFDYEDNVFVQVCGHKRFVLVSPDQSALLYPSRSNVTQSRLDDAGRPDLARFPRFADAVVIEDEIGPGESLVLPRTWWHHFRSLDETVSLGCFFGRATFWRELVPIVNQLGPRYWARVGAQFVRYGMLRRSPAEHLYSHPPNGLVFYNSLLQWVRGTHEETTGSFFES